MMRSESKRPCCPKPSMYFTMRGLSCRNCSKEDRIYRPAKEDFFEMMGSESFGIDDKYEGCTDQKATIFDKHGSGIGGWIDCAHQRGSKSIDSSNWCGACFKYYGGDEEFGAMMMPKRYLMICPECDETVPEMESCISCNADLTTIEIPEVEVVDLEAEATQTAWSCTNCGRGYASRKDAEDCCLNITQVMVRMEHDNSFTEDEVLEVVGEGISMSMRIEHEEGRKIFERGISVWENNAGLGGWYNEAESFGSESEVPLWGIPQPITDEQWAWIQEHPHYHKWKKNSDLRERENTGDSIDEGKLFRGFLLSGLCVFGVAYWLGKR